MLQKLFVLALVAASALAAVSGPSSYPTRTGDMDMLMKQKKIFELLMYVNQNVLPDAEYFEIGRNYDIVGNMDRYDNQEWVMMFLMRWKIGMLNKDALFSYYKQEHREEMVMLYRLFYSAKDFNTFYKTACWARIHLNSGMYVSALTTAVLYRDDCKYLRLPAINEIYPNMFFDNKLIRDAYRVAMTRGMSSMMGPSMNMHSDDAVETYHLYSNFTDMWMTMKDSSNPMTENSLAYFTDDVSMNSWYYYMRMMFPFWVNTKEYNTIPKNMRGDIYYFMHQQLLARYMLERMSNGLDEMTDCSWMNMCIPMFQTNLVYGNGVPMPRRDWWNVLPFYKQKYLEYLQKLEIRIMEAIDSGYIIDEQGKQISLKSQDGLNLLGNLIEGNYDSINMKYYSSWEALARKVLGMNINNGDKNSYIPSSLDIFATSMRDPAFYRIMQKMVEMIIRGKSHSQLYSKNELEFNGVRIENVEMDRLVTFWENKDYLVNNAIDVPMMKDGKSFNIKAWQYRLNHKPFTYKINVNSDKTTKAVMRIFLGPAVQGEKYDDYSYLMNYYKYFFMLDEFELNLREGSNNIERHSSDSILFKSELMTGDKFYKKIIQAIQGKEPMNFGDRQWGFPANMMLPKGSADGMRYKLFFYISPYENAQVMQLPIMGKRMWYGKPLGFPLDRPMQPWMLRLDNVYLKDVLIYNIVDNQMIGGRSQNWGSMMMKDNDMMSMMSMKGMDKINMKSMDWNMMNM